jgi:cardiolipin synthase
VSGYCTGNRITLLSTGTEYFPALEAAIDAAEREVRLETYIFADDSTGHAIASALSRAALRGVATHLLIDGFGAKDLSPRLVDEMQQAGVLVLRYRPAISPWTLKRGRLRRLHRKIAVIDAKVAFVGGINVIDDMHTPGQTPPRFDYAVRVEGPLLVDIHHAVAYLWQLVSWTQVRKRGPSASVTAVSAAAVGNQRAALVIRDNLRHRNDIERAYLDAIAAARVEIVIACAYFFPGRTFRRALVDAAARGVRVVLLLQGRVEYVLLHYASRALYQYFLDAGVEIFEYHRSFLHAKVAVVDGVWATVGSSNIDPMSLLLAREANVMVEDAGFAAALNASLVDAMRTGAHPVLRAHWQQQAHSVSMRAMTWICYQLVRFLSGWSSYGRARDFQ